MHPNSSNFSHNRRNSFLIGSVIAIVLCLNNLYLFYRMIEYYKIPVKKGKIGTSEQLQISDDS